MFCEKVTQSTAAEMTVRKKTKKPKQCMRVTRPLSA